MSSLPKGWTNSQLKEVAEIITGSTPSTKNPQYYGDEVPFIKPGDLDAKFPLIEATQYLSIEGAKKSRLVRKGASLVSCIGNLGKVGYAGKNVVTNQQINSVEFYESVVNDRFGFYQLKTLKNWMEQEASATTISILNKSKFSEAPMVLAPMAEQSRIADKLDTVLTRVDAVQDRLARITPLLKRFRQSILAAATSGRLTEEWRKENGINFNLKNNLIYGELPYDWKVISIDDLKSEEKYSLAIGPFGSNLKTSDYTDSGIPLVFVREIRTKKFGSSRTKFITKEKATELNAHQVTGGDILITKMGDPPGDVAIYSSDQVDAVITADCIKLKVNPDIAKNSYISFAIESPSFKSIFMTAVAGVAQQKVSLSRFRELPVVLPPLEEQTEIVRRVELLMGYADRLEARLQAAQTAAERLTPALLAKAFRGELVPQDPNDAPAAELLRRLRESRAAEAPAKPKPGRAGKLKAVSK